MLAQVYTSLTLPLRPEKSLPQRWTISDPRGLITNKEVLGNLSSTSSAGKHEEQLPIILKSAKFKVKLINTMIKR